MPVDSRKQLLKPLRVRKYLNKDFDGFRADLLDYARTYYSNTTKDFTEAGIGGLLLDLPAYVGDVMSLYMDHQFHESSPETAVETRNIQRHLKDAGVKVVGASPAVVDLTFVIKVPADQSVSPPVPSRSALPVIYAGTVAQSENSTFFELTEDIDFTSVDKFNALKCKIMIADRDSSNIPTSFFLSLKGVCLSGQRNSESFSTSGFSQFRRFSLSKEDVTEIISVTDDLGNTYYEVEYLTQDTVFKALLNKNEDNDIVRENLEIIPAPYRFISETDLETNLTSLTFGGGNAETLDDDIVPDPSEFAIPLYGKRTFSRFSINPGNLLQTSTLGIIAPNATLSVEYRYGGGVTHNIPKGSIRGVTQLNISFPNSPSPAIATAVRESLDAYNEERASGGSDAPSVDELKQRIPAAKNAQARIVSKEDLLGRIYKMPANFGRVFRASTRSNPNNPLAARLYIICRDAEDQLIIAPDSLKKNLALYLNSFRLISDAIDILDAQVINLKVEYTVVSEPKANKQLVLQNINSRLVDYFGIKNFDIDQPLVIDDIRNIIYNTQGVVSVQSLNVKNISGTVGTREYSDIQFDVQTNTNKGIIIGPAGSMFEVKYKNQDIVGSII